MLQCDLNFTNLGYGGQCHLDPMVARMIRDLPADYISLCLGINVHGGSLGPRTFRAMALGLILTIRDGHPTTPMVVVSPVCSPPRETKPGLTGMTLPDMRRALASAVQVLRQRGDVNLHYIDGLELLGPELAALHMPDQLHPDAQGYRVLAQQYLKVVMPTLLENTKAPAA
ncbi:MAG: SGNH/GDSL hydrolase family protein [Phycisphaeraceae bacterium]